VLPEGNHARFFLSDGWLAPVKNRLSFHRAFGLLSFLNGSSKEYVLDTSLNGEERAFVATGVFEDVLPFDIFPMHLFKAIMAEDLELMEALGIYELIEEDVALCEFVDVSKHDLQALLRKGLDLIRLS
jgi:Na+-transporting NADH:ubiquinone oxidoreductase subunit A